MKYHLADLIEVRKQYRDNFAKLVKAYKLNSPEHSQFIKEEKRLNHLEIKIMSALGSDLLYKAACGGRL